MTAFAAAMDVLAADPNLGVGAIYRQGGAGPKVGPEGRCARTRSHERRLSVHKQRVDAGSPKRPGVAHGTTRRTSSSRLVTDVAPADGRGGAPRRFSHTA